MHEGRRGTADVRHQIVAVASRSISTASAFCKSLLEGRDIKIYSNGYDELYSDAVS